MKKMIFIFWLFIFGCLLAQSPTRNITFNWDLPPTNTSHGVFIYLSNGYNTNYTTFSKIITVFGSTNTSCTVSNLAYGSYSIYSTSFATNSQSTNVLESLPSNIIFLRHSPPIVSDKLD